MNLRELFGMTIIVRSHASGSNKIARNGPL